MRGESYGLLSHNALGRGSIGAGGLVDVNGDRVPGSFLSRFLLGGKPAGDVFEHF